MIILGGLMLQTIRKHKILPQNLRDKKNQAKEKYDELNEKYNRANLDIQNLKRKSRVYLILKIITIYFKKLLIKIMIQKAL